MVYDLQAQPKKFSFTASKMGSPFHIIIYGDDSLRVSRTATEAFLLVDSLVAVYSDYIDSSELNRLCARAGSGHPFTASPALFDILQQAVEASRMSGGSFDITMGPLTRLWRRARKDKTWPDAQQVREKRLLTGYSKIRLEASTRSVWLQQEGMQLDLGGIAQGYIAQKVVDHIRAGGHHSALVNVSGDIVTAGAPPGKEGWTVAVNQPESQEEILERTLLINDRAVTTSGNAFQFMEHNGKKYSHIINPRTGYGTTGSRNVTVIAKDGITGDWLTKACSLLPVPRARRLARQLDAEFLITELRRGKIRKRLSRGFDRYWKDAGTTRNDK